METPLFNVIYVVLYVTIKSGDTIYNMAIQPKLFLLDQINPYVQSDKVIVNC